jgi:hypothetical protein
MYKPQRKHRANHGNYFKKPTKGEVNGLLRLYAGVRLNTKTPTKKVVGVQLKLKL